MMTMKKELLWTTPVRDAVVESANKIGVKAFFVGGLVRDALIERDNKDIDICVVGHPSAGVAEHLVSLLSPRLRKSLAAHVRADQGMDLQEFLADRGGSIALALQLYFDGASAIFPVVYPRFLTAMTDIAGQQVEFTGAREDHYDTREGAGSRARNPQRVSAADEISDARRRDFTINALFVDLHDWSLLDPTELGVCDLETGIIRVTRKEEPEVVFGDDPLRMLRAIRFACQLGYKIDRETFRCIKAMVKEDGEKFFGVNGFVSAERIRDELSKMMLSKKPEEALRKMYACGILQIILPEVAALKTMGADGHKDIWEHTLVVMRKAKHLPKDLATAAGDEVERIRLRAVLSAMLHDSGKFSTITRQGKAVSFPDHQNVSCDIVWNALRRLKFDLQMIRWVAEDCRLHRSVSDDLFDFELPEEDFTPAPGEARTTPQPTLSLERLIYTLSCTAKGKPEERWGKINELVRWHIIASDSSSNSEAQGERVAAIRKKVKELERRRAAEAEQIRLNRPLLDGNFLMQHFGLPTGEWIGEAHKRMRADRLDHPDLHDEQRALAIATEVVEELGLK